MAPVGDHPVLGCKVQQAIKQNLASDEAELEGPIAEASPIDTLYGRFAGRDLLDDLEQEHRWELATECPRV